MFTASKQHNALTITTQLFLLATVKCYDLIFLYNILIRVRKEIGSLCSVMTIPDVIVLNHKNFNWA